MSSLIFLIRKYPSNHLNRPLGLAVLLGVQVIWGYALVGKFNPSKVNTYKELTAVISNIDPTGKRPVVVYNFWAPSISFYLPNPFVTVKSNSKRIAPEVQFEENKDYLKQHIDTEIPGESERLLHLVQEKEPIMIFLSRDSIPEPLFREISGNQTREMYDKYTLYY
jgi:hypothetical protein